MNWNSPISVVLDVVLGVIPAILFGALSSFGLFIAFVDLWNKQPDVPIFSMPFWYSVFGLLACVSMVIVTLRRQRAQPRWLFILVLLAGVYLASSIFFQSAADFTLNSVYLLPYLAISLIAVKHIVMLARA